MLDLDVEYNATIDVESTAPLVKSTLRREVGILNVFNNRAFRFWER